MSRRTVAFLSKVGQRRRAAGTDAEIGLLFPHSVVSGQGKRGGWRYKENGMGFTYVSAYNSGEVCTRPMGSEKQARLTRIAK